MRIIVATLTGKRIVVDDIKKDDNFQLLSAVMFEKEGIPESQQRYIFAGKEIEQSRTFNDYNVQNDSLIHMVLRLSGKEAEFPTLSLVYHGGIGITPSFNFPHDCDNDPYRENYGKVYKAEYPLFFLKPLEISFDLSKLCLPRKCYQGKSKERGGGFICDKTNLTKWRSKKYGELIVYELVNGKMFTDSYAKMVRNRKEVLRTDLGVFSPDDFLGNTYYGARSISEVPRKKVTLRFFPKGKKKWKENALYMCVITNNDGGFRWTFMTSRSDYDTTVEDEVERVDFVRNDVLSERIMINNQIFPFFGLMKN